MVFVPNLAPLVVMAFLLGGLSLALSLLGVLAGAVARNRTVLRVALLAGLVVAIGYGATWAASGLLSSERTLAPGERKIFCEIDCHLAYTVVALERTRELGHGPAATHARGEFWVVTLQTWFDPSTISPQRPRDATLTPNPRHVVMVDATGHHYPIAPAGQQALEEPSTPLETPLVPGESYRTRFVFDLPTDVREPRLLLTDSDPMSALLIGHESAPLHRKAFFALPPVTGPRAAEPSGESR